MSLRKFWTSVRAGAGRMGLKAAVDSPRLDRDRIETMLRSATFWLNPRSVKGYEFKDFDFLPDEEHARLDEGVREFRKVISTPQRGDRPGEVQIDGGVKRFEQTLGVIRPDQIDEGVRWFGQILEVIRPDQYADPDALELGKKIEAHVHDELPSWVREMVFETGDDSSGAPALWVWVEVEDEAARRDELRDEFMRIRQLLFDAGSEICPERWVYVRTRTVSEQRPDARPVGT